ncbi:MAG: cobalt ECF transporter T component CbiQ [Desulfobacteraceae bacterium]|nr:cobalt ECF transporter T component CbiQ [Desulfobacteraceae bacterium]
MDAEPFASGRSWVHRVDARLRIIAALVYSVILAVSNEFATLMPGLIISVLLTLMARLDAIAVSKRLLTILGFIALIWVMLPLTYNGDSYIQLGPLAISAEGVGLSARISLKTMAISMSFMALIATMSTATLGHALSRLGVSQRLVILLLMTYRYLFVLENEYHRLRRAARVRGFKPGTDLHTYRTYAYLVGMLFIRAAQRAERVYQAMRCRGFKGRFFTIADFPASPNNFMFSLLMAIFAAGLILMEFNW